MKNQAAIPDDSARLGLLEDIEQKIANHFRRGLELTCALAKDLRKVIDLELWELRGCESWNEYARDYLPCSVATADRILKVGEIVNRLKDAGRALPGNESQAAELARIDAEHQIEVWDAVLQHADEDAQAVTVHMVRTVVENATEQLRRLPAPVTTVPSAGVITPLDEPETQEEADAPAKEPKPAPAPPTRIMLSERGEAALERVRRLCGDIEADSIEYLIVPISERDLIRWGEQDSDEVVKTLGRYVIDQRWSVAKALKFEESTINPATPLSKLMALARVHGGSYSCDVGDYTVTLKAV